MIGLPSPDRLEEEAIYLGVLTAWRVKPLSRLEYSIKPDVKDLLQKLGLLVRPVLRVSYNGTRVYQLVFGMAQDLVEQYLVEFNGAVLQRENSALISVEAQYFGFPICCAMAYIEDPYAPNNLLPEEQALLFHWACPECAVTPRLIPCYRLALVEARRLHKRLRRCPSNKDS